MSSALTRYRIVAWIVGVLIIPTYISLIFRLAGHPQSWLAIFAVLHGYCYIVYMVLAFDLYRRAKWSPPKLLAVVAAGLLPGFTFLAERRVTADVRRRLAES